MPGAPIRLALGLGLLLAVPGLLAAHITDKLAVGLYAAINDLQPRRVLASNVPVERLTQKGRWCQVRLGDGDMGWLECQYLTNEKPARVMLLEIQAQVAELRQELAEREQHIHLLEAQLGAEQPSPLNHPNKVAGKGVLEQHQAVLSAKIEPNSGLGLGHWLISGLGLLVGLLAGMLFMGWRQRQSVYGDPKTR